MKHNKKRNTAFIYECLIREATVAIIKNDTEKQNKVVAVIKKHFAPTSILSEHLQCYKSLYETTTLPQHLIEKVLKESNAPIHWPCLLLDLNIMHLPLHMIPAFRDFCIFGYPLITYGRLEVLGQVHRFRESHLQAIFFI